MPVLLKNCKNPCHKWLGNFTSGPLTISWTFYLWSTSVCQCWASSVMLCGCTIFVSGFYPHPLPLSLLDLYLFFNKVDRSTCYRACDGCSRRGGGSEMKVSHIAPYRQHGLYISVLCVI